MKRPYADPDCPKCKGEGWIYAPSMITMPGDKGGRDCECTLDHHRRANMERIWPSLSQTKDVPGLRESCPLLSLTKRDLWITSQESVFRKHFKAVCYRKNHMWDVRVWSDKDLVKAWLNTAYAQGHKIYDTELDTVRVTAMYIDELVESYELVVFMLGVKTAPNKETPSVLLEAIKTRRHLGRPSWVLDQPAAPLMTTDHRAYSEALEGMLLHWPHIRLTGSGSLKIVGGAIAAAQTVSDVDPDDLLEAGGEEVAAEIENALSDLNGDEEVEGEDEEGEDDEGEDDEGEDDEGEDDEGEDDEGVTPTGTRNLLDQMKQNEEVQEEQSRLKAFKKKSSNKPFGRKR